MSDTPRTDNSWLPVGDAKVVDADFARTLERELNEAVEALKSTLNMMDQRSYYETLRGDNGVLRILSKHEKGKG